MSNTKDKARFIINKDLDDEVMLAIEALDKEDQVLPLTVHEDEEDGSYVLSWDETHPVALILGINDWGEEEWNQMLVEAVQEELASRECEEMQLTTDQPCTQPTVS